MSLPAIHEQSPGFAKCLRACPAPIAIVGPFQPETVARLLPAEAALALQGLTNFAGVPVNWLAGALAAAGIPTTVIGGIREAAPRTIVSHPLSVYTYTASGGWPFLLNGRAADRNAILRTLSLVKPAVAHAHWTFEAGRAVADWNGPKVLTVHDAAWEYARLGWSAQPISMAFTARWLWNTRQTLQGFDHLIAVSPYLETYLRLHHGYRGEIRVIPNAIEELPAHLVVPSSFPKSGVVTFGLYGEPGRLKNLRVAIEAFQRYTRRYGEAKLLIYGGGWSTLAAEMAEDPNIVFAGTLPHPAFLQTLVETVDVWVHPSLVETQGLVLCEALMAGCPVIAGHNSGAVAWTLDYGRAGLLVDVHRPDAIMEAMHAAVDDRTRSLAMVAFGQQEIRTRFAPNRIRDLHLEYYADLAA